MYSTFSTILDTEEVSSTNQNNYNSKSDSPSILTVSFQTQTLSFHALMVIFNTVYYQFNLITMYSYHTRQNNIFYAIFYLLPLSIFYHK